MAEKWEKKSKERLSRPHAVAPQTNIIDFTQKPIASSAMAGNQPFFDLENVSSDFENDKKNDTNADRRIKSRNKEAQEAAEKAEEQTINSKIKKYKITRNSYNFYNCMITFVT